MAEIIQPKFKRNRLHQIRMLKSKPSLAKHPEFQNLTTPRVDVIKPTLFLTVMGLLFLFLGSD